MSLCVNVHVKQMIQIANIDSYNPGVIEDNVEKLGLWELGEANKKSCCIVGMGFFRVEEH